MKQECYGNAIEYLQEFLNIVDSIYGIYLDAITGFNFGYHKIIELQEVSKKELKKQGKDEKSIQEYLDNKKFVHLYGNIHQEHPLNVAHASTQGDFKQRNQPGGHNDRFIANMCIVTLYQYWEYYRAKIEKELQQPKDFLQIPIMGDIRQIRISIIHNKARAIPEIKKCEILQWFQEGDSIIFSKDMFRELIGHVKQIEQIFMSILAECSKEKWEHI